MEPKLFRHLSCGSCIWMSTLSAPDDDILGPKHVAYHINNMINLKIGNIRGVSKGHVNPYGGDSGPYLVQKILIYFFRIRFRFRVMRP